MSRRVRIPSVAAATAFDELCQPAAEGRGARIDGSGAVLVVDRANAAQGAALPLRSVGGRLRGMRGRRWFPVEVELAPWSHAEAQVGIRPLGRRVPMADGRAQHRYIALAFAIADHLAAEIEAAFAGWERDAVLEAAGLLGAPVGT